MNMQKATRHLNSAWTKGTRLALLASWLFACCVGVLSPVVAQATTFNIANGDVAGLIAAINAANATPGSDINLAPGGSYILTAVNNTGAYGPNGLPVITSPITINGNGATLQRSSAAGTPDFRIFFVAGTGNLTLNGVTISGGGLFSSGGGILNFTGRLKVIDSLVTANRGDGGAGIYNLAGAAELINSTVSGNSDRFYGAGIWNDGYSAILTLTNSSITANSGRLRGTGIYNLAGTAMLINSTVSSNGGTALNDGGGISNAGGTVELVNSTVSGNTGNTGESRCPSTR